MLLAVGSLHASVVVEDFLYPSNASATALAGNANGGSGWAGGWAGNANVLYNSTTNLQYSGYAVTQAEGSGSLYSQTANFRSIYRSLDVAAAGEVWFSFGFRYGGTGAGGLIFNDTGASSATSGWSVLVNTTGGLNVTLGGVSTNIATLSTAVDYLVLGRMITGDEGAFDLWLSPNLGGITSLDGFLTDVAPTFSVSSIDNPLAVSSLGVAAYRGTGGSSVFRFDALRLSDGNGNAGAAFHEVSAVIPEANTIPLVLGAFVSAVFFRRYAKSRAKAVIS